jgi:hypothetical protein
MEDEEDFFAIGASSLVHANDVEAAFIEEGGRLLLWNGDTARDLWVDKYDVRCHLTDWREIDHDNDNGDSADAGLSTDDVFASIDIPARALERALGEERYRDLPPAAPPADLGDTHTHTPDTDTHTNTHADTLSSTATAVGDADIPGEADKEEEEIAEAEVAVAEVEAETETDVTAARRFAYVYPDSNKPPQSADPDSGPREEEAPTIELPFAVPAGTDIPYSKKQLDVILHTALKTRKSIQLEIFLKVKQAGSPMFAFLTPGNRCYNLYSVIDIPMRCNAVSSLLELPIILYCHVMSCPIYT